ncbi:hypothetical protein JW960_15375 [candidate division KSB1 bacterium]|nr:hypothetical protein [candidate division KSB1 bacterium]
MRHLLKFSVLFLVLCNCQSTPGHTEEPQPVPRITYEVYPNEWYTQQEQLWKKEIEKNPQNANAWHNYYNAVRYADFVSTINTPSKADKLNKIISDMEKAIPESYEYYYLKFKTEHKFEDIQLIEKAHQLKPEEPEPLYDLITYNEIHGNTDKAVTYYQALYDSRDIAPWLLDYNYNVLMSVAENGILVTNGDNDSYPARMLQAVRGVRPDVTLMNISMSTVESYFNRKLKQKKIELNFATLYEQAKANEMKTFDLSLFFQALVRNISEAYPKIPIYIAYTVYPQHFKPFKDKLYMAGLAYCYSPERIDNLALLKKQFEQQFRLDYLADDWYADLTPGKNLRTKMHLNYVPPAIMLAEHYALSNEHKRAIYWKNFALRIVRDSGIDEMMKEIEEKQF